MNTNETAKIFALEQIAPYFKDKSLCGYHPDLGCMNITNDGKMCVAGKNYTDKVRTEHPGGTVGRIIDLYGQAAFKEEARNKLDRLQWTWLQNIHDKIATSEPECLKDCHYFTQDFALFTYNELVDYCKT